MSIDINPSILSSDFSDLRGELEKISTADMAHIDVMDNHFVPNLTFGPPVVERIQAISPIPLDAHLMIADADRNAPVYAEIGCASVTFHAEAAAAPVRLARELRARAKAASPRRHPRSNLRRLPRRIRPDLIMTVEPGRRQKFLDGACRRSRRTAGDLRRTRDRCRSWGVSASTIERVIDAGAVLVAGRPGRGRGRCDQRLRSLAAAHTH